MKRVYLLIYEHFALPNFVSKFIQFYQWSPDARSSIIDLVNFDR